MTDSINWEIEFNIDSTRLTERPKSYTWLDLGYSCEDESCDKVESGEKVSCWSVCFFCCHAVRSDRFCLNSCALRSSLDSSHFFTISFPRRGSLSDDEVEMWHIQQEAKAICDGVYKNSASVSRERCRYVCAFPARRRRSSCVNCGMTVWISKISPYNARCAPWMPSSKSRLWTIPNSKSLMIDSVTSPRAAEGAEPVFCCCCWVEAPMPLFTCVQKYVRGNG